MNSDWTDKEDDSSYRDLNGELITEQDILKPLGISIENWYACCKWKNSQSMMIKFNMSQINTTNLAKEPANKTDGSVKKLVEAFNLDFDLIRQQDL